MWQAEPLSHWLGVGYHTWYHYSTWDEFTLSVNTLVSCSYVLMAYMASFYKINMYQIIDNNIYFNFNLANSTIF